MTTMPSKDTARLDAAVESAESAFWADVAANYPEAKTGDFSPEAAVALEAVLRTAIVLWLEWNADEEPVEEPQTAEILLHRIEYFYRHPHDSLLLTDSDKEHIAREISAGIREGELCTMLATSPTREIEVYGYWNINNCPDV